MRIIILFSRKKHLQTVFDDGSKQEKKEGNVQ